MSLVQFGSRALMDTSRQHAPPRREITLPTPPGRCAAGYSLVLPPGWHKIPLRTGTTKAIRSAIKDALASLPRNAPPDKVSPYRMELERRLTQMARQARGNGGIDLYLPIGPVYQAPVAASFLVSELSLETVDPSEVTTLLAAEKDTWQTVTVDDADALRVERTADIATADGADLASRRADYVLPVPGRPGRWLAIAFSTLGGGDPDDDIAKLLTELFDSVMLTFRWEWESG
jgi:hypothetical protein